MKISITQILDLLVPDLEPMLFHDCPSGRATEEQERVATQILDILIKAIFYAITNHNPKAHKFQDLTKRSDQIGTPSNTIFNTPILSTTNPTTFAIQSTSSQKLKLKLLLAYDPSFYIKLNKDIFFRFGIGVSQVKVLINNEVNPHISSSKMTIWQDQSVVATIIQKLSCSHPSKLLVHPLTHLCFCNSLNTLDRYYFLDNRKLAYLRHIF